MKVKIGNTIYDAEEEPIMIILDEDDKINISKMETARKYCVYPDDYDTEKIKEFMEL
jgi:hypothetical protein